VLSVIGPLDSQATNRVRIEHVLKRIHCIVLGAESKLAPVRLNQKYLLGALVVIPLQRRDPMLAGTRAAGRVDSRVVELSLSVGDHERLVFGVEEDVHSHVRLEATAGN
jgi:hypothetical protein